MSRRPPIEPPVDEDVRRELRFHLEMRERELREQGMDARAARQEALRAFGNYERIAGECRSASLESPTRSSSRMLESVLQDTRFAARSLRRAPGFVLIAIMTLALGIGANTAIFSVVHGVLLTPLPYPDGDRIVSISEAREDGGPTYASARNFVDWKAGADAFESMALFPSYAFSQPATVLGGSAPTRAWVVGVTEGFFATLGIEPVRGRGLSADEWSGNTTSVLVSHRFWETFLGGETDLSRIELRAYGSSVPVVGVMPPGFRFPGETDIWWPVDAASMSSSRTSHGNEIIGKLREGVSLGAAQAELTAIHEAILATDSEDAQHPGVVVQPLHEQLYGSAERPLLLLLGAAGLVLLMACTNLASGLLARGAARERELAIRASLGAHRKRIVRQLFTESLLLGVLGGVAGVATGMLAVRFLVTVSPDSVPRAETLGIDGQVLAFALCTSLATTLLFGLLPAIRLARGNVSTALRTGSRGNAGDGSSRVWSWLVAAEVALAVLLLVGSGLLLRSFREVVGTDVGFEPAGVMTVSLSLPGDLYPTNEDVAPPVARILDEIGSLPGVVAAGAVNNLPLSGISLNGSFEIEGRPADEGGYADYRVATEDYFEAMGIPLIRGRMFATSDDARAPHVAIINRAAAERFWPDEDPVGQRISGLANDSWVYDQEATIVGIVGDVRHRDLVRAPSPEVYVHYRQRPMRLRSSIVAVRTVDDPSTLTATIRSTIASIDDQIPLEFVSMEERVGRSLIERRFVLSVTAVFSVVALVLAVVGIYGVVSYSTSRRTRELGIRMALGAAPGSVWSLVVRDALWLVGAGLGVGVLGALAGGRLLESLLYGVRPADPPTFVVVVALLVTAACLAAAIPAWRGSRVDPMITMRGD